MLHHFYLDALERYQKDITEINNQLFGRKVIVPAEDFCQHLPVVLGVSRVEIVNCCINRSHLWENFKKRRLTQNMEGDDKQWSNIRFQLMNT